jgi:hypothetical protein
MGFIETVLFICFRTTHCSYTLDMFSKYDIDADDKPMMGEGGKGQKIEVLDKMDREMSIALVKCHKV